MIRGSGKAVTISFRTLCNLLGPLLPSDFGKEKQSPLTAHSQRQKSSGFVLIEARNLNEAIRVASKIPPARLGCIEVRPIKELTQPVAETIANLENAS